MAPDARKTVKTHEIHEKQASQPASQPARQCIITSENRMLERSAAEAVACKYMGTSWKILFLHI